MRIFENNKHAMRLASTGPAVRIDPETDRAYLDPPTRVEIGEDLIAKSAHRTWTAQRHKSNLPELGGREFTLISWAQHADQPSRLDYFLRGY